MTSSRVLVIEDNRANLDLMVYLLRAFGHAPVGVSDGLSGLEAAQRDEYDLVLTDILMPSIDGYELARRFRSDPRLKDSILVAVTALAMVGDRERVLAAGFDGYVSKPIDPQTFVAEVETFLARRPQRAAARHHPPAETAEAQHQPAGPVILAVDDIQVNLDVIEGVLQPFGYRVVRARSAREGIEKARATAPALIICDLHMPDGDGFKLITDVKSDAALRRTPFLFISSTAWHTADKVRGLELGAAKFLLRPIEPCTLLREVESALRDASHVEDSRR
jgi:two-component system cell cycle response regulator